ncbi:hypothetical protein BDL97_01G020200 [Sphagnum fallax]|nr:hypothetical protein BDL97_01G020200 [Sphagnum fallax]
MSYKKNTYIIIVFVLEPRRTRALRCALLTPSLFSSEVVHFLLSFSLPIATPVQKTKSERRIQEGREDRHQQQQRQSMKVIDKINNGLANHNGVVFSFEFFPPRTEEGIENLYDRMDRMVVHQPAFCDITWGAGGSTSALALDIANKMQNMIYMSRP